MCYTRSYFLFYLGFSQDITFYPFEDMWGYPEIYNDLVKPLYTIEKSIASGKILMIYSSSQYASISASASEL